jgi:hypothetical protein
MAAHQGSSYSTSRFPWVLLLSLSALLLFALADGSIEEVKDHGESVHETRRRGEEEVSFYIFSLPHNQG